MGSTQTGPTGAGKVHPRFTSAFGATNDQSRKILDGEEIRLSSDCRT